LSRLTFEVNFRLQNDAFCFGNCEHFGHMCQKQPSMNIATRNPGKKKSGLPRTSRRCICQPAIPRARSIAAILRSVERLSCPQILDITSDRFALEKTSISLD
jgi:hypothetical protein